MAHWAPWSWGKGLVSAGTGLTATHVGVSGASGRTRCRTRADLDCGGCEIDHFWDAETVLTRGKQEYRRDIAQSGRPRDSAPGSDKRRRRRATSPAGDRARQPT